VDSGKGVRVVPLQLVGKHQREFFSEISCSASATEIDSKCGIGKICASENDETIALVGKGSACFLVGDFV
jgi:hypothetical protein